MKKDYTHIVLIVDRSGSMEKRRASTISAINEYLGGQRSVEGTATLTLNTFSHTFDRVHDFVNLSEVADLTEANYAPKGTTALYDAIGHTFAEVGAKLAAMPEEERPEKVMVAIFTDGVENASRFFSGATIKTTLTHQREKYSWEVAFMGADEASIKEAENLGVPISATLRYDASDAGTRFAFQSFNTASARYRTGKTASLNLVD